MDFVYKDKDVTVLVEEETKRIRNDIMDQLVHLRTEADMTQQDIADATGMHRANISRLENKHYMPTIEVLVRYAGALGMKLDISFKKAG